MWLPLWLSYFTVCLASKSVNSLFLADGTTFTTAAVVPQTGALTTLTNFTILKTNEPTFDDSWGTSCMSQSSLMFAGIGFGYWQGTSGSGQQVLLSIDKASGKVMYVANLSVPKTKIWLKNLKYDPTQKKLFVATQTNNWNPSAQKRFVISEMDYKTGNLKDIFTFDPQLFSGTNMLLDQAFTFNQNEGEWIGIAINNDDTVSLWKVNTKTKRPLVFVPLNYNGLKFKGRIWGMLWTKKWGIVANTEHVSNQSSVVTIDPSSGVLNPVITQIPYTLTNWEPGYDPATDTIYTYGSGMMFKKFVLSIHLPSKSFTSNQMNGKNYNAEYLKGFCTN